MTAAFAIRIVRSVAFLAVAVPTCWYAARRGGGPERAAAGLVVLAMIATTFAPHRDTWHVSQPLLVIDVATLLGFVIIAAAADRYWPLYVAAIQLLTVALHGVRAYDPTILPQLYTRFVGELAYPLLLALVIGTRRHARRGVEADWTWQVSCELPIDRGDQR